MVLHLADEKTEVIVKNYSGDQEIKGFVEIRGIVNKDQTTLSYGQMTSFGMNFDLQGFEKMMKFYHGSHA